MCDPVINKPKPKPKEEPPKDNGDKKTEESKGEEKMEEGAPPQEGADAGEATKDQTAPEVQDDAADMELD